MTPPRMAVNASDVVTGSDRAVGFGIHVQQQDGHDWLMNDATTMDVGVVEGPSVKVAVVTLYHRSPILGTRIGLTYSMSVDSAREVAAALSKAASDMEAAAASDAAAAIAKARRP